MFELRTVLLAAVAFGIAYVARGLVNGYKLRARRQGLPGPPHSWLFGDLGTMGKINDANPARAHPHAVLIQVRKMFNLPRYMYLDLWPITYSILVVQDPDMAQQVVVEHQALKHPIPKDIMEAVVGPDDMVTMDGPQWKMWRTMFAPGFSNKHVMSQVPGFVDDVNIFIERLSEHAERRDVFRLFERTSRLTVDAIGRSVLNIQFNMQRGDHAFFRALTQQLQLLENGPFGILTGWSPLVIYQKWCNNRIMSDYFGKVLDDAYAKRRLQREIKDDSGRTTLDLALDSCFAGESSIVEARPEKLNPTLRTGIITQLRTFVFAGHDTTAATICYLFYVLSKNPTCLQRLREEHEIILGSSSTTASTLKSSPHLLNQLEYTHCVIKETLRLYPIGGTVRSGSPSLHLTDRETGEKFPTDGYMIMIDQYGMGRSEDIWGPDANDFNPDRFMPENSGKIPKGAYRAFELGPKNCIGQNFAIMEMKVVLALVARVMEFSTALDEEGLAEVGRDGSDFAKDPSFRKGKQDVEGEEMYQVLVGAAKPREGMPVRVKKVDWKP
ncbi:unnamed protein product [Zymoseptoria tritici ST99CH_3D1]|nr:unnamed protein product [Zymoseptoria tritici ST99CH_3D1]